MGRETVFCTLSSTSSSCSSSYSPPPPPALLVHYWDSFDRLSRTLLVSVSCRRRRFIVEFLDGLLRSRARWIIFLTITRTTSTRRIPFLFRRVLLVVLLQSIQSTSLQLLFRILYPALCATSNLFFFRSPAPTLPHKQKYFCEKLSVRSCARCTSLPVRG